MARSRRTRGPSLRDVTPTSGDTKSCARCGRVMTWRRAWAGTWDEVRWCSERCRRRGLTALDEHAERTVVAALADAPGGATLSIVDVVAAAAPVVTHVGRAADGRRPDVDEAVRCAARRLAAAGRIDVVVGGRVVDPSTAKGDVGFRRGRAWG